MSDSMHCIIYREKGDASKVLEWVERPIPDLASGEVRVRTDDVCG
jgi:NADPH:quinone reductase-like Zn-dependent oxidoreductase